MSVRGECPWPCTAAELEDQIEAVQRRAQKNRADASTLAVFVVAQLQRVERMAEAGGLRFQDLNPTLVAWDSAHSWTTTTVVRLDSRGLNVTRGRPPESAANLRVHLVVPQPGAPR